MADFSSEELQCQIMWDGNIPIIALILHTLHKSNVEIEINIVTYMATYCLYLLVYRKKTWYCP